MFTPISIFVHGEPKGQPRPRAFARGGMVRMYDPATAEGWKSAIADEWRRSAPPCSTLNQSSTQKHNENNQQKSPDTERPKLCVTSIQSLAVCSVT
jgi:hypothetical protein